MISDSNQFVYLQLNSLVSELIMSILRRVVVFSRDVFSPLMSRSQIIQSRQISSLSEVGKLEAIKIGGNYDTGQMFLHKVFGYRGVVLFPWLARVYDRDLPQKGQGGNRLRMLHVLRIY